MDEFEEDNSMIDEIEQFRHKNIPSILEETIDYNLMVHIINNVKFYFQETGTIKSPILTWIKNIKKIFENKISSQCTENEIAQMMKYDLKNEITETNENEIHRQVFLHYIEIFELFKLYDKKIQQDHTVEQYKKYYEIFKKTVDENIISPIYKYNLYNIFNIPIIIDNINILNDIHLIYLKKTCKIDHIKLKEQNINYPFIRDKYGKLFLFNFISVELFIELNNNSLFNDANLKIYGTEIFTYYIQFCSHYYIDNILVQDIYRITDFLFPLLINYIKIEKLEKIYFPKYITYLFELPDKCFENKYLTLSNLKYEYEYVKIYISEVKKHFEEMHGYLDYEKIIEEYKLNKVDKEYTDYFNKCLLLPILSNSKSANKKLTLYQ